MRAWLDQFWSAALNAFAAEAERSREKGEGMSTQIRPAPGAQKHFR